MQDESLRRYERELARAGFGTPRDVAAALLRSTPSRYWLVCGPSYPFPGALWSGSAWWPKEGPAGNANLPFPVTGWTHSLFGGVPAYQGDHLQVAHLIAYRVVGIEEAETLKAPFEAHGWSLRLWDAVSQKQVMTYGFPTLDAVEEGWASLADQPFVQPGQNRFGVTGSNFAVNPGIREEFLRAYEAAGLAASGVLVDPPLTVRVDEAMTYINVDHPPPTRTDIPGCNCFAWVGDPPHMHASTCPRRVTT